MSTRVFYRTVYTVEVLSTEPVPGEMCLTEVLEEAHSGSYSADVLDHGSVPINAKEAAFLLRAQRSCPSIFALSADGEDLLVLDGKEDLLTEETV